MPETQVFHLLLEKRMTLATAESCSGGLLAHRLTNIPGISEVFLLGVVSYSNSAKARVLGVDAGVIEGRGAVSPEVAGQMAAGVQALAGSSLGVGITGIAGPGGGTAEKPVGTVYMGLSLPEHSIREVRHFLFKGDRESIKLQTTDKALAWICEMLEKVEGRRKR